MLLTDLSQVTPKHSDSDKAKKPPTEDPDDLSKFLNVVQQDTAKRRQDALKKEEEDPDDLSKFLTVVQQDTAKRRQEAFKKEEEDQAQRKTTLSILINQIDNDQFT